MTATRNPKKKGPTSSLQAPGATPLNTREETRMSTTTVTEATRSDTVLTENDPEAQAENAMLAWLQSAPRWKVRFVLDLIADTVAGKMLDDDEYAAAYEAARIAGEASTSTEAP